MMSASRYSVTVELSARRPMRCRCTQPWPHGFNDAGVSELYQALKVSLVAQGLAPGPGLLDEARTAGQSAQSLPGERERYLSEVAGSGAPLPRVGR